jgi:integrase
MRGSITPHKGQPDVWRLRVYLGTDPVTGKERYRSKVVHAPKRQAEKILNQMVQEANVAVSTTSSMTVEQLLGHLINYLRTNGRSHTTIAGYEWRIRDHLVPAIGDIPITKLTAKHLDDLYTTLLERNSPSTVRQTHAIIHRALNQAERWGWIDRNVATLATSPRVGRREVQSPSENQLRAIIDTMSKSNPQFGVAVVLAALTGARRGELLGLRWADIEHEYISIRGSLTYTKAEGVKYGPTKTHQVRRVMLDDLGIAVIQSQKNLLVEMCTALELNPVENPWLFFGEADGSKPLHPDSISSAFRRTAIKLGIEGIHFHSLRHFTATQLIAAGVDIRTVSGRLGHANASMTLGIYSHVLEAKDREAGQIMGQLLKPDN